MTLILHAQPYDITAEGFYFRDAEEYYTNADELTNSAGDPVEEFEIQFIDGDSLECLIALSMGINQANFARYFELMDELNESDKIKLIIAGECGYTVESAAEELDSLDIDIFEEDSYRDLAMNFVDEGLFGEIPEHLAFYIDYDAIARDLAVDYGDTRIDGKNYIYRSC